MKSKHNYQGADYIRAGYDIHMRKVVLRKVIQMIKDSGIEFDTIVFRGMSGCLMGPTIADKLGTPMLLIRKEGDNNHGLCAYEGHAEAKKYIIVDDLISSGNTMRTIISAMESNTTYTRVVPECVGIFLYAEYDNHRDFLDKIPIYACKATVDTKGKITLSENTHDMKLKYPKKGVDKTGKV